MELPEQVDVLVVGLGPVGAALACLLGRYGVRALVVERAAEVSRAPRAIALDNEALRILQQVGLPEGAFETIAIPHVRMRSPLFGEYARANTTGQIDGHPKLVTFFQPDLESALRRRLSACPSVSAVTGVELVRIEDGPDFVRASLSLPGGRSARVRARYLVGCDGACSFVRKSLGLDFRGETYAQDWLIVDVRGAPRPIDHVEFLCDPARPAPHMPAPGGRQRWEFMLRPGETREQMERPEVARELLRPWTGGACVEIERIAVYRFHARVADRFSAGGVFLAGDAAHVTPPFAGQGLVSGLRDASNLGWKLSAVVQGRASAAVLASYDAERRPHAAATIAMAKLLGRLIMPRSLPAAFALHGLAAALELFPPTRRLFGELEIKTRNRFDRGLFRARPGASRLGAGSAFPQGLVRYEGAVVPSDDVLGDGLCLVGLGADPAEGLPPGLRADWLAAGGRFLQICHRGQTSRPGPASGRGEPASRRCEDVAGTFLSSAAKIGWAAVIRPDRMVMCEGPARDAASLLRDAQGLLGEGRAAPRAHGRSSEEEIAR